MSGGDRTVVAGGRVVTPDGTVDDGTVVLNGDRIDAVDDATPVTADVDATDLLVVPGIVDLHGDDIERHLFPRADDSVPPGRAVQICDQANIAAGVTTKCHALAFEDAPDDNRSLSLTETIADAIADFREGGRALTDHRLHLRCELTSPESIGAVCDRLGDDPVALASLMTHIPGDGQFDSAADYAERYGDGGSVSGEQVMEVVRQRRAVPERTVRARARRVIEQATRRGVPVAAHDSADPDSVEQRGDAGVSICEFPVNLAAARAASSAGLSVAMGAPNLVRGGSNWGNLSTRRTIRSGTVDVLCSDFRPQSLLKSVFVDTGEPLADRVARVTSRPADAIGLDDRGRLAPGARADLLVVDPGPEPRVVRAFVGGQEVYRATPATVSGA